VGYVVALALVLGVFLPRHVLYVHGKELLLAEL
jgi:hypothetical protein